MAPCRSSPSTAATRDSLYCTCRSQSSRLIYGLRSHACNSCMKSRVLSLPKKSDNRSSACPPLPLTLTVLSIATIYSSKNSEFLASFLFSLKLLFRYWKTCSSLRIHFLARSSSSRENVWGVRSRNLDKRLHPTWRE